jgi:ABC-2 type transport system ATP-binding protein
MSTGTLVCESLTKVYGDSKGKKALDSVSLEVPSHGIFSLIGMNGAGKTTLVRILATQLEPTAGRATIDGLDVMADAKRIRENIACIPQEARTVPWMTPKQTVLSYLLWRGVGYDEAGRKASEALARVGLEAQENLLNRHLSGGTKRKAAAGNRARVSARAQDFLLGRTNHGARPNLQAGTVDFTRKARRASLPHTDNPLS